MEGFRTFLAGDLFSDPAIHVGTVTDELADLGTSIDDPNTVLARVGLREEAFSDHSAQQLAALWVDSVVDAIAPGQESQPVDTGSKIRPEGVGGSASVPAH